MPVLNEREIKKPYFDINRGFPPTITELSEYTGKDKINIACTQLNGSDRDKKRVLTDWINFFHSNRTAFKAIYFRSHVPQRLFNAACCQENLNELYFKWGAYTDLSALENLKRLKYLYIGSGAGVRDITTLGNLKTLIVLHVENFKRMEDYSLLTALDKLEQLVISGPILGKTPIKDLDFLVNMQSLLSFWRPNTTLRKKYTSDEWATLRMSLPNLTFCYNSGW